MNIDNPFDQKLKNNPGIPDHFKTALIECTDTLDMCLAAVKAVFGEQATPEHALTLLPIVMAEAGEKLKQEPAPYAF